VAKNGYLVQSLDAFRGERERERERKRMEKIDQKEAHFVYIMVKRGKRGFAESLLSRSSLFLFLQSRAIFFLSSSSKLDYI